MLDQITLQIHEYFPILIFMGFAFVLSCVAMGLPFLLAKKSPYKDKVAPYECGFDEFGDARDKFDIRFYLVGILFIIFDIEVIFLFPWAIALKKIGVYGFASMMAFLFVLIVGLIYEWRKGALDW